MGKVRLHDQTPALKWALSAFLLLSGIGFSVAALMSHNRYGLSHEQTLTYYLGNEAAGGMEFPKLYPQLLQTAHVHSFSMPVVFFVVWLGLAFTPIRSFYKKIFILGGVLSILTYNAAPFLVRYQSAKTVSLFTIGGIGLFFFFIIPALLLLYEMWFGFSSPHANST